MNTVRLGFAMALTLTCSAKLTAQPAQNSEEAAVFIEVSVQDFDATTNQSRLKKVGAGSGVLINKDGWVITASHIVKVEIPIGARLNISGSVRSRFATKFPLEMLPAGSVESDVRILRFPPGLGVAFPYLCVLKHPEFQNRQKISALGFPLGFDLSVRPGEVTSISGPDGLIQTNLGLAQGMSGGPVINDQRAIVGIVHGGIEGQSSFDYFTPVNMALPVLDAASASYVGENCAATGRNSHTKNSLKTGPTFDCKTVKKDYEVTICGDADLWQLDWELSDKFYGVWGKLDGEKRNSLRADQDKWKLKRGPCGSNALCLKTLYEQRIRDLQSVN
jgi:S1-C subfamily serine protease